jgi:two-component system cell cycle sensor histidine kinase/response regulator CckA
MTDRGPRHPQMTALEVARLGEREALARLELISTVSQLLEGMAGDCQEGVDAAAEACVEHFADLCAVEVVEPEGFVRTAAYRTSRDHGLRLPAAWSPVGRWAAPERRPVLHFVEEAPRPTSDGECPGDPAGDQMASPPKDGRELMERLGARSLLVVPITFAGKMHGWLVAATGAERRGFRPSALQVAGIVAGRMGAAIHTVRLRDEMQAHIRNQGASLRRLRRLAGAAGRLAGAASPQAVLETACREACAIHEARGAAAFWVREDGTRVTAATGEVDAKAVERAFASVPAGQPNRAPGWIAYPLATTDPWQHGALVVFAGGELSSEEEPLLGSLAALVPIAFERALGTEASLAHEARLRTIVESSPVALFELREGRVASFNRRAQDLFGWSEPTGRGPVGPLRPDGPLAEKLSTLTSKVTSSGRTETEALRLDERELSLSAAPLPPRSSGDVPSLIVAGLDLTEVRQAQRALVQAQRLDAMGQVAGRVAHDFNNLLTLIVGYASLLRREIDDHRLLDMVASIDAASKRAASLTRQMLDMTRQRVDTGVVIDLSQAVSALQAVLGRVVGPLIDLRFRTSTTPVKVRLDPSELEQILLNLVINASDAIAGRGRIEVTAEVATAALAAVAVGSELPPGPLALLSVVDDGPGMNAEVRSRCLEPFFTTKEKGRGSGLGLATVYGLVRERGGQMEVDSYPGRGTSIRIWLPTANEEALSGVSEPDGIWPAGRRVEGRVVMVEDEDLLRDIASEALASTGLEAVLFASAEDAMAWLEGNGGPGIIDALVTDVILPGRSGVDLAADLWRADPGLPVVFTTAYTGSNLIPPDHGDSVLSKPYTVDALALKVAEAVELGRIRARSGSPPP